MVLISRFAGAAALLAAATMAVPAAAIELPAPATATWVPAVAAWDGNSQNADNYRRYRRNRGIDAGDVIAGAVILGTVAAIANAASRNNRDRDYRDRDYRDRDYRNRDYRDRPYQYRPYQGNSRYGGDSRGIDRAVDMCVREIERDSRVQSVDSVERTLDGWRVAGSVANGGGFTCRIGGDGRIEGVDYGQRSWNGASADDRQWDSEAYAAARRDHDDAPPAYPGARQEGEDEDDYGV